jgi:hypothetical protein
MLRRFFAVGLVILLALLGASSAAGKEFEPGDLRLCDGERCVPVMKRAPLHALAVLYYTGPRPDVVERPGWGAPAYELRYRNGYVTGVVGTAALDRFLSFGVHLGHFRRGAWHRVPPGAARELRRLAAALEPLRVTPAMVRRSR